MSTARSKIAAELSAPGVCVQVLDYRWSAGETIYESADEHIMSYRAFPRQVTVSAVTARNKLNFGKLFFFPAGVQVGTDAAEREELVRTIQCRFEPNWFSRIWDASGMEWDDRALAHCFDMHSARIEQAVQRLGTEATNPGFASGLMVDALSNLIAVEIARYFQKPREPFRARIRDGKLSENHLQRIYEYVHSIENLCPSISDIAQVCNISPAHLRRSFKKATGRTVHDYVEDVRLDKTKSLLAGTDLPLKEVAYRVGFANLSSLSSGFKRLTGESSSEFRYRMRN